MNSLTKCLLVASLAALSFATTACSQSTTDDVGTGASNLDQARATGANTVTSCWGSEPFWNVTIDSSKVQFKSLDDSTLTIANKGATPAEGTTASYAALYQGQTSESPNKILSVIITTGECHDESEETYNWNVSIVHGNQLFTGCCR